MAGPEVPQMREIDRTLRPLYFEGPPYSTELCTEYNYLSPRRIQLTGQTDSKEAERASSKFYDNRGKISQFLRRHYLPVLDLFISLLYEKGSFVINQRIDSLIKIRKIRWGEGFFQSVCLLCLPVSEESHFYLIIISQRVRTKYITTTEHRSYSFMA